jgi:hypothetical protein
MGLRGVRHVTHADHGGCRHKFEKKKGKIKKGEVTNKKAEKLERRGAVQLTCPKCVESK